MIGGVDVIFPTKLAPAEALDLCTRVIMACWRKALVQNATTATVYPRYPAVPFEASPEFIIYRDQQALESWDELGADPSNQNTMIHLLHRNKGRITVVVDDKKAEEMRSILEAMDDSLKDKSLRMGDWIREAA